MSRKLTKEEIVERSNKIHDNKYDYSEFLKDCFEYKKHTQKIPIICHEKNSDGNEHGIFWQSVGNHTHKTLKQGCPICGGSKKKTTEEFIKQCKETWGDTYSYENVKYVNAKTNVTITCHKHGDFPTKPMDFIHKRNGCPKCKFDKLRKSNEDFVKDSKAIFGENTYRYDKAVYINNQTKLCLVCPKHGEFWKTPNLHLSQKQGCPICSLENKVRSKLEEEIETFLREKHIRYIREYRNNKIFGKFSLDFFLPDYNVGIECQGEQHFISFSDNSIYNKRRVEIIKKRDKRKKEICDENGIKLLYYSKCHTNLGIEYPYKVYEDKNDLLNEINK